MQSLTIVTPSATISGSSLGTYTYVAIASVSPNSGPPAGGTPITITGSGLSNTEAVYFGDQAATNVTIVSATEITATTPPGSGSVAPSIVTSDGGESAPATVLFTYAGGQAGSARNGAAGVSEGGMQTTMAKGQSTVATEVCIRKTTTPPTPATEHLLTFGNWTLWTSWTWYGWMN